MRSGAMLTVNSDPRSKGCLVCCVMSFQKSLQLKVGLSQDQCNQKRRVKVLPQFLHCRQIFPCLPHQSSRLLHVTSEHLLILQNSRPNQVRRRLYIRRHQQHTQLEPRCRRYLQSHRTESIPAGQVLLTRLLLICTGQAVYIHRSRCQLVRDIHETRRRAMVRGILHLGHRFSARIRDQGRLCPRRQFISHTISNNNHNQHHHIRISNTSKRRFNPSRSRPGRKERKLPTFSRRLSTSNCHL